nr:hypothetical protein [Tanacetum cinerariifolium]
MSASNQQTLAGLGANERPPMLEKGNYIQWESRFTRFLDNKLEEGEWMWRSIEKGAYVRLMIPDLDNTRQQIMEPLSKMTEIKKKQYIADEMWERIKRLMYGSDVTNPVRHSRLMDEFDKFAAKEGESLESVYERLTTLVNIIDRNNVRLIPVSINTKFLKCFAPRYHGELQGDSQEDKLTTAMMLLARAITHKFSTPTNNRLCTSSNTKNQAVIQYGIVDIQTKNVGYGGNGNRNAGRQNKNQAFNAENGLTQTDEIIMMIRIQPAYDNAVIEPNYDAKAVSEVTASHKMIPKGVHEHKNHEKRKTVVTTSDDDQIDSNIISDDSYVENNSGSAEHDSNAHDQYPDVKILEYSVQREDENLKRLNNELKKQKELLQKEFETCKERVKTFKSK